MRTEKDIEEDESKGEDSLSIGPLAFKPHTMKCSRELKKQAKGYQCLEILGLLSFKRMS